MSENVPSHIYAQLSYRSDCALAQSDQNRHCTHFCKPMMQIFISLCGQRRLRPENGLLLTKTCLYNVDPLKPHYYIVKLGFTGVYLFFLFLFENIDCGYSLEPPRRGGSKEYPQFMFWAEIWKISEFLSENFIWKFSFFGDKKNPIYLNNLVFVMSILQETNE